MQHGCRDSFITINVMTNRFIEPVTHQYNLIPSDGVSKFHACANDCIKRMHSVTLFLGKIIPKVLIAGAKDIITQKLFQPKHHW
jgi:hypothetical protein